MKTRMRQGRHGLALITAVGVAGLAGLALVAAPRMAGGALGPRVQRTVTRLDLALDPGMTLHILNTTGRITVHGWDANTAHVTITREVAPRGNALDWALRGFQDEPSTLNTATEAVVRSTDSGVQLSTLGIAPDARADVSYHFEVKLPRGRAFAAANGNGPISVSGIEGNVAAISENGDLHCDAVIGGVSARVRNGNVVCRYVSGAIDLNSTNGSVEVDSAGAEERPVCVRTSNGAIIFHAPAAPLRLRATTENGRIVNDAFALGADTRQTLHTLSTRSGESTAEVELHALNGNIYLDAI